MLKRDVNNFRPAAASEGDWSDANEEMPPLLFVNLVLPSQLRRAMTDITCRAEQN